MSLKVVFKVVLQVLREKQMEHRVHRERAVPMGKTERRVKMDWTVHRGHQVIQEVKEQAALTVRQALRVIAVLMEVQEVRELQA